MTATKSTYFDVIRTLKVGKFTTLESRLDRGGALQGRRLSNGVVKLYWRFSHEGDSHREPIGTYDPKAPPLKLEPTASGYSIKAALRRCDELAKVHSERLRTGGLKQVKAEEKQRYREKKAADLERQEKTLGKLFETYVAYLRGLGRRSAYDAENLFRNHVQLAVPRLWSLPAADITPDDAVDLQRRLIELGKGRTANKLRAFGRAAFQCAIDARSTASIPVAFRAFAVVFNPFGQTKRDPRFDRADKRPLGIDDLRTYWRLIRRHPGLPGVATRLHLLTGGQRIEQLVRLRRADTRKDIITIYDAKGRPGQGPRPHTLPLIPEASKAVESLPSQGEYVLSTTQGDKPMSATTLARWAQELAGKTIEGFQAKRIRSGVETLLAAHGVSREIRGYLQSHGQTGVQAKHYDAYDYLTEKRQALELLFNLLERRAGAKVIPTGVPPLSGRL